MNNPDAQKTAITCGVYHSRCLWCGCGRYLIGLDPTNYLMKYYKPVIHDECAVTMVTGSHGHIWVGFTESSLIAVCDVGNGSQYEHIDCQ